MVRIKIKGNDGYYEAEKIVVIGGFINFVWDNKNIYFPVNDIETIKADNSKEFLVYTPPMNMNINPGRIVKPNIILSDN